MIPVLLALFPVLLIFAPRLAWIALAAAIAMLVGKRFSAPGPVARRRSDADYDASV